MHTLFANYIVLEYFGSQEKNLVQKVKVVREQLTKLRNKKKHHNELKKRFVLRDYDLSRKTTCGWFSLSSNFFVKWPRVNIINNDYKTGRYFFFVLNCHNLKHLLHNWAHNLEINALLPEDFLEFGRVMVSFMRYLTKKVLL